MGDALKYAVTEVKLETPPPIPDEHPEGWGNSIWRQHWEFKRVLGCDDGTVHILWEAKGEVVHP